MLSWHSVSSVLLELKCNNVFTRKKVAKVKVAKVCVPYDQQPLKSMSWFISFKMERVGWLWSSTSTCTNNTGGITIHDEVDLLK